MNTVIRGLCVLFGLAWSLAGLAAERVALVIGNGAYQVGHLANAPNDAEDIAKALRGLDFHVDLVQNADRPALLRAVDRFRDRIRPEGLAVIFYSGHGVEVDGENWLLPVQNREIRTLEDVPIYSVLVQAMLRKVEAAGARLNLVILDACRDSPLPAASKTASRGLAEMRAGRSTLLAYATAPGSTASDGAGRNSPYTAVLKEALQEPGLSVTDLVNKVGATVEANTQRTQVPWNSGTSIWPPIYLAGLGTRPVVPVPSPPPSPAPSPSPSPTVPSKTSDGLVLVGRGDPLPAVGVPFRHALRSGGEGPVMVGVPGGSYLMGSPESEADRDSDEGPQRRVTLSGFGAGKYEVTVSEFRRFVDATKHKTDAEADVDVPDDVHEVYKGLNPGCYVFQESGQWAWESGRSWRSPGLSGSGDQHPVVCVSWNDAQAYVRWLAQETGAGYRLPSESEQEWLLRGGREGQRFGWGSEVSEACGYGNVAGLEGAPHGGSWGSAVPCNDGSQGLSAVGRYASHAFGLQDVLGNALEWSADCYGAYSGARTDGGAVQAPNCRARVLRGASWHTLPAWLRSADRLWNAPANRLGSTGFRLALDR